MAARKTAKKEAAPAPVRVPPKLATQGPESGPSGDVVVDADAPGPLAPPAAAVPQDAKAAKQQASAQKTLANEKAARQVKVRATRRGFMGHKVREEGDVFIIDLAAGQKMPSWVEAVTDDVPTSPVAHSAEAQEEVVDDQGIGHTPESLVKETFK